MTSNKYITTSFKESARVKSLLASVDKFKELGEAALQQLDSSRSCAGVIRIFSDFESRWSAHHLNEELVVRFKAGAAYGREDRPAINAREYSEFDCEYVLGLINSERFNPKLDTLVFFAARPRTEDLELIARAGKQKNFSLIVIAPEANSTLLNLANFAFALPTAERSIISCLQSLLLHSFCERFEPEYDVKQHDFAMIAGRSKELDLLIAAQDDLLTKISKAKAALLERIGQGASVFLAGNGGSTCDANALASYLREPGVLAQPIEVFDLHAPDTLLCAYNDNHTPFARQIVANGRKGDVVLIYSTSGNSQNIIDAVNAAKGRGILTVGLLGKGGGKLASLCDISIIVPSDETARVQEVHALIGPMLFV